MQHRRSVARLCVLALAVVPACYAPHNPIVGDGSEEDGSGGSSAESGSEGPTTSATTGPSTSVSDSATTDPDGSSDASGESGPAVCGNGTVEGDEVCDDGINDGSYDGCEADCTALGPHCGDAVAQGDEACDDGDDVDGNGCNVNCIESGTVLWTRTLDIGALHGVDVDEADGVLVIADGADLLYLDVDGNDGWSGTYEYPGATGTGAAFVAFDPIQDWMVGGSAGTPTQGNNLWWRGYSQGGAGATTSVYDNSAHTNDRMAGAVFDSAGNLYVFGDSDRSDLGQSWDLWLRKHDTAGDELWTRTYDSGDSDFAHAIAIGADDSVIIGGSTGVSATHDAWLRKYGPEGNELWTRSAGAPGTPWDEVFDLAVGPDLEVVATGVEGADLWVRKYSADGGVEWSDVHGDPFMCIQEGCAWSDSGNGVAVDSTGAVIVVGDQMTSIHGVDIWIRKYDADGVELWTDEVSAPNPEESYQQSAYDVVVTSTDDIVVVGAWDETGIGGEILGWIQKYAP